MSRKQFLRTYVIFLALTSIVAWTIANPPQTEQFATVSVLGKGMAATDYFPGNNSTVANGQSVTWYGQVYNHMGSAQLFMVRAKLANESIPGPDIVTHNSSAGVDVLNLTRAVRPNETWTFPLIWSVANTTRGPAAVTIPIIEMNNEPRSVSVSASLGTRFRIIVELWSYDLEIHDFIFSIRVQGFVRSLWSQVWFSAVA